MDWRIYYGDGIVFDDLQGIPAQCPSTNVQAVVVRDDQNGNAIWHGFDWYLYARGEWIGVKDIASLVDHLLHDFSGIEAVLQGRTIGDGEWKRVYGHAMSDPDFPSTSRAQKKPRS